MTTLKIRPSSFIDTYFEPFVTISGNQFYRWLGLLCITGIFWFLAEMGFVYVIQIFLHSLGLITNNQVQFKIDVSLNQAVMLLIVYGFFRSILLALNSYLSSHIQQNLIFQIRSKLYGMAMFSNMNLSSREIVPAFSDLSVSSGNAIFFLSRACILTSSIFFFGIGGTILAPLEMILSISILFILVLPLKLLNKSIAARSKNVLNEWGNVNEKLVNSLKNSYFLKAHGMVDEQYTLGNQNLLSFKYNFLRLSGFSSFLLSFPMFVGIVVLGLVTYYGHVYFRTPSTSLLAFFYIFIRFVQSFSELNSSFSSLKSNIPSVHSIAETFKKGLGATSFDKIHSGKVQLKQIEKISFQNVTISFRNRLLFKNLNFELKKGHGLRIKGSSGSGKSTIIGAILGIVEPNEGSILINETHHKFIGNSFYNQVALVGADPFLLPGTVRENLLYGNSRADLSDNEIWSVLDKVSLSSVIQNHEGHLEHKLTDNPAFSLGQKQRIALARALLRNPSLLILDEATSNLDFDLEKSILEKIELEFNDKIVILVGHKDFAYYNQSKYLEVSI